jgi:hypothetical protein
MIAAGQSGRTGMRAGIGRLLGAMVGGITAIAGTPAAADPLTVTWQPPVEVAAGAGHRGPWRMNESDFDYVDDPTVAINDAGVVAVAWADQARQDVFLQVIQPGGDRRFAEPVNVSRTPEVFSWLPRLRIGPGDAGNVYVLWQEIVFSGGSHGGEIFFARATDGGRSFTGPINLSNSRAGDGKGRITRERWHNGSLDLAVGTADRLYAAWTTYEGDLWVARSTDGGASFAEPIHVAGPSPPARGPSLAIGPDGTIHLAWTVGADPSADLHMARSTDRGRSFSGPRAVLAGDGHAEAPKIEVDAAGRLHLVYAESPAGPFRGHGIRYARSAVGTAELGSSREISAPQADRFASASFPHLALDGTGNLYVAWELIPQSGHYPEGLGYTVSDDGGDSFAKAGIVPDTRGRGFNGSRQGFLMRKLAVNDAGQLALVNSTHRRGESSHIWLYRGRSQAQ